MSTVISVIKVFRKLERFFRFQIRIHETHSYKQDMAVYCHADMILVSETFGPILLVPLRMTQIKFPPRHLLPFCAWHSIAATHAMSREGMLQCQEFQGPEFTI